MYDLAKERFSVYVPRDSQPNARYGLFVWIDPQSNGVLPAAYKPIFDSRRLIWIAPDRSGANRPIWHRLAPAIDAVHNMTKRYAIDAERVYVGGIIDGGRSASFLAVAYPEVFKGGFYAHAAYFFRQIEVPSKPGYYFYRFEPPLPGRLQRAKTHNRYVFLSGDNEFHRKAQDNVTATYRGYRDEGFEHIVHIEAPGLGRGYPPGRWFREAVAFLEDPSVTASKPTQVTTGAATADARIGQANPSTEALGEMEALGEIADDLELWPGTEVRIKAPQANNSFLLYVPSDYTPERAWPIIFCYHGYSGSATTWPFKQVTLGKEFIIVGMNYAIKKYHMGLNPRRTAPEKAFFDEAYAIAASHLNVDADFIFMGGYSQGGYSTTVLGDQMLDRLAGRLVLGAGRRDVDGNPPPLEKLQGGPVFFGVGELDDPHYVRAKRAAQIYRDWGADVTFEGWPGETHGLSSAWFQKTKMRDWLMDYGPLKQVKYGLAEARAAEQAGQLGEAFALYRGASEISPADERCMQAAAVADELSRQAEAQLADAAGKPYREAAKQLRRIASVYAGSVFAERAQQQLKVMLNTRADELEARARAAEAAKNYTKASQLYQLYLTHFSGADRYLEVKVHMKMLKAHRSGANSVGTR